MRLKKSTSPVLPQQSSTLKEHAEVVRFTGTPVATGKNVVKFSRRPVLHPINNGGNADNNENENSDLLLISIIIILPLPAEIISHQYQHHVIHIHHSYKMLPQVRHLLCQMILLLLQMNGLLLIKVNFLL